MDDIGRREEQQDRVAVIDGGSKRLLALADGLGGHEGGAQAAQAPIDVARESLRAFERSPECTPAHLLVRIVLDAHERIIALGRESDYEALSAARKQRSGDKGLRTGAAHAFASVRRWRGRGARCRTWR